MKILLNALLISLVSITAYSADKVDYSNVDCSAGFNMNQGADSSILYAKGFDRIESQSDLNQMAVRFRIEGDVVALDSNYTKASLPLVTLSIWAPNGKKIFTSGPSVCKSYDGEDRYSANGSLNDCILSLVPQCKDGKLLIP